MEGFDESKLTLRSTMMFKWRKVEMTYFRRHKEYFFRLVHCWLVILTRICEEKNSTCEVWSVLWSVISWGGAKKINDGDVNGG